VPRLPKNVTTLVLSAKEGSYIMTAIALIIIPYLSLCPPA